MGQVRFFAFDDTGGAFSIDSRGSTLSEPESGSVNDTEIGLYDSDGFLVDHDDDGGEFRDSRLDFADGDLTPGRYYLAAGGYEMSFDDGFGADSSAVNRGTLVINGLSTTPVPEPASTATLGLGALAPLRRRRRAN